MHIETMNQKDKNPKDSGGTKMKTGLEKIFVLPKSLGSIGGRFMEKGLRRVKRCVISTNEYK